LFLHRGDYNGNLIFGQLSDNSLKAQYNEVVRKLIAILLLLFLLSPLFALERGIASWYDSDPNGPLTANGEVFDPNALKAAHKSLRFGTVVRVTDIQSKKHVDVVINDRGPFVEGRIIDLTPEAARVLGIYVKGITEVELKPIFIPDYPISNYNRLGDTGYYKIQIGTYANLDTVETLYNRFRLLGFHPIVEIVDQKLSRLTLRWIEEKEKERTLKILKTLGFEEILLRGDMPPDVDSEAKSQ
jgi:rare lipoprotein A